MTPSNLQFKYCTIFPAIILTYSAFPLRLLMRILPTRVNLLVLLRGVVSSWIGWSLLLLGICLLLIGRFHGWGFLWDQHLKRCHKRYEIISCKRNVFADYRFHRSLNPDLRSVTNRLTFDLFLKIYYSGIHIYKYIKKLYLCHLSQSWPVFITQGSWWL